MGLLAFALVTALLIQRAYLGGAVRNNADEALDQEVEELRQIAAGPNPATGEAFGGDVQAIFETFFARYAPLSGEFVVTFVDGRPYKVAPSRPVPTELVDRWATLTQPERDAVNTGNGPLRYVAVPMFDETGEAGGVFVAAFYMQERQQPVDDTIRITALVLGSIFVLASVVAWIAAGDVLRPVRLVTDTARSITQSDLSRRIPVESDDEVGRLASTFNEMLDRLEEAFATQRRFVDDAGHELRTPITVIRGQLELLGDDPEERRQTMELVNSELDRMSRMVEDLLILARSETPDFIEARPIDLQDFMDEMTVKASGLAGREVTLERADPGVFTADRQRLTQAVTNLVRNSVEHGGRDVKVSIGGMLDGARVRIWVEDDGPGVPDEVRTHLFERFYRGNNRRSGTGAGLGLSIVRAIVEGHGGSVDLQSRPGRTKFEIVLPAAPSEEEPWPES
ncbi:MAG TPA: HAMP domain-containing sensor histidine kinase [Acidimicrobiia bacterium]